MKIQVRTFVAVLRVALVCLFTIIFYPVVAQKNVVQGIVRGDGMPLPGAICHLQGFEQGVLTDSLGRFFINNLPVGKHSLKVQFLGFLPADMTFSIEKKDTVRLEIELQENPFPLHQAVVSGTRTARRKLDNPVAVNVLSMSAMRNTQSNTLSEGLCFQPGLRMETDCQTCNYTQLRMNGLAGRYAQILVDSRPVFNALMSLYGLEQIPASQIERVEVVRGGGSALFGANAVAGTVNIITREPRESEWSVGQNLAQIGGRATDFLTQLNATVADENQKSAATIFAARRRREAWDANEDGFSEMPRLENLSLGSKILLKPAPQHKIVGQIWHLNEHRRGGDQLDLPPDQASQAEERQQNMSIGGVEYIFSPTARRWQIAVFSALQNTRRRHYTGIDGADGWGNTHSFTNVTGAQWSGNFDWEKTPIGVVVGIENQWDKTFDEIKGYQFLVQQRTNLLGVFAQADIQFLKKWTLLSGLRWSHHNFLPQGVLTPRLNLLFRASQNWQWRASFGRGFTAPQAFEADLHIAFANGGISRIFIDPKLREETSNSFNFSVDFNRPREKSIVGFTLDLFATRLFDSFVLEELPNAPTGTRQLLRKNGGHSTVAGCTVEQRANFQQKIQIETGWTVQVAHFDQPVVWSQELSGTQQYLRTPQFYGYFSSTFFPKNTVNGSLSGVYTGKMWVPHFSAGGDVLHRSSPFFEINVKLNCRWKLPQLLNVLNFSAGVQNVFNAFQRDFDIGKERDSNYFYGPARPRTLFLGLTFEPR